MSRSERGVRHALAITALSASIQLAGCGSVATTRFHSLLPALPAAPSPAVAAVATVPAWELAPVVVPVQLDVPQLVVRLADDSLAPLEHERWIAPLADELRAALALAIGQRLAAQPVPVALPAASASASAPAPAARPWRVAVEVLRMDSVVGRQVRLEAQWTLRPAAGAASPVRCRGVFEQPATAGVSALVASHRQLALQLGERIGAQLQALAAGDAQGCDATVAR